MLCITLTGSIRTEDAAENNDGYRAAGYTIELRDTGRYGFLLPPDEVPPINLLSLYKPIH